MKDVLAPRISREPFLGLSALFARVIVSSVSRSSGSSTGTGERASRDPARNKGIGLAARVLSGYEAVPCFGQRFAMRARLTHLNETCATISNSQATAPEGGWILVHHRRAPGSVDRHFSMGIPPDRGHRNAHNVARGTENRCPPVSAIHMEVADPGPDRGLARPLGWSRVPG